MCSIALPGIAASAGASPSHTAQSPNGTAAIDNSGTVDVGGMTFVPLDSWVYPALRRLAALGFIPDQNSGLAPWTRAECARQVSQAHDLVKAARNTPEAKEALRLLNDLDVEFPADWFDRQTVLTLESVYTRFAGIAGTPLRDSYHFGQTIVNDYGRRYDSIFNNVTGFSGYANFARFFGYVRGEYQYAPGRAGYNAGVQRFIAQLDQNPVQPPGYIAKTNRFDVLEAYAGIQIGFENISFGKQSLWWGPGEASAFSFTNNAEPFYMLNFVQNRPVVLPSILRYLGKMRTQFIFGRLQGHHWPRGPLINAQKVSFDLTKDLEVGFTASEIWGGEGHPETLGAFFNSLFSTSSTGTNFRYGDRADPGDRHSGFDLRYRVPGLRRYVTIYTDSFADDEPNPLSNPGRSAWGPGIYISHLPKLTRLDLRFETYSTQTIGQDYGPRFFYWNNQYHDSYTNDGNILGSWVGRDARTLVAEAGYWIDARTRIQFQYRQTHLDPWYSAGLGGTQTDGLLYVQWGITPQLLASGSAQYERYYIPIIGSIVHHSGVAMLQLTYTPHSASQ